MKVHPRLFLRHAGIDAPHLLARKGDRALRRERRGRASLFDRGWDQIDDGVSFRINDANRVIYDKVAIGRVERRQREEGRCEPVQALAPRDTAAYGQRGTQSAARDSLYAVIFEQAAMKVATLLISGLNAGNRQGALLTSQTSNVRAACTFLDLFGS
jgi:hypothetical protein